MKFFIPAADDDAQRDRVYGAVKEFLGKELGAVFDERRVRLLDYVHEGVNYLAEVGKPHALNGELVLTILHEPGRALYHVCTENRGVVQGGSILVGGWSVKGSEDFDRE